MNLIKWVNIIIRYLSGYVINVVIQIAIWYLHIYIYLSDQHKPKHYWPTMYVYGSSLLRENL